MKILAVALLSVCCFGRGGSREASNCSLTHVNVVGLVSHTHQQCFEWLGCFFFFVWGVFLGFFGVFLLERFCIGMSRAFLITIFHLLILNWSLTRKLSFVISTRNLETWTHSLYSEVECSFQGWCTLFQKLIFRSLLKLLSDWSHWKRAEKWKI